MKKILLYAGLVLLLITSLCMLFAACDKDLTHDMEIDESLSVAATCYKDGSVTYKCKDCDHQVTVAVKSVGHQFSKPEVVLPTCTEEGGVTYKCSACEEQVFELLDQLGHSFGSPDNVVAPTCKENGSLDYKCERCGTLERVVLEPGDHEYKDVVTPPTCIADGYTTPTCDCGLEQEKHTPTPATGKHLYEFVSQTQVACGEKSVLTYRCIYEDCNDTVTKEVLIEHELGENGKCRKTGCTYDICEQLTLDAAKNAEIAAGEAGYFKISLEAGIYGVNLTPAQGWTLEIFSADDVPVSLTPDGELPVPQAATYYFKLTNTAASAACSLLVFSVA